MTFIVKTAATLRLADGSSFDLVAGMHDDFPENVKEHWAFASYAEPVDTSKKDSTDQKGAAAAKKQIKQLQEQLKAKDALLDEKEVTIAEQMADIDRLKARVTELEGLAADADELRARIAELEKPSVDTDDGSKSQTDKPEGEKKDAKKQQASDS
ncbi:TPA: hypothetical protein QCI16_004468 [Enterobacter ludwigii]|nr:hypothetical protein [Enterobacter ludwigii]HDR2600246.1 hypothetical protein [Enterobacter ludwigii]